MAGYEFCHGDGLVIGDDLEFDRHKEELNEELNEESTRSYRMDMH